MTTDTTDMTDTESTTSTTEQTTETDAWQLPLDDIWRRHRDRIAGHPDQVPAMVEAWHEGEDVPAWSVWIGETNDKITPRDAGLHAAKIMAEATGAEYVMFSFDTHMSSRQENPETGKPWAQGEMQRMCDEEGYCDTGNIRDNLAIAVIRRSDRKILFHSIPYHFHADGSLQFWPDTDLSEWDPEQGGEMRGMIPDGLRAAMASPTIEDTLEALGLGKAELGFTDSEEDAQEARLHQVLAGARILAMTCQREGLPALFVSAIPARNDKEAAIIRESAERAHLEFFNVGTEEGETEDEAVDSDARPN